MSAPVSSKSSTPTATRSRPPARSSAPARTSPPAAKPAAKPATSPSGKTAAAPPTRDSVQLSTEAQSALKSSSPASAKPSGPAATGSAATGSPAPKAGQDQATEGKWGDPKWEEGYTKRMEALYADHKSGKISDKEYGDGVSKMYGESLNKFRAFKQERAAQEQREAREKVAAENQAYNADMGPRRTAMAQGQKDIDGIVNIKDDKVRNLNITQKYSELSKDMRDMMGPDSGANWSTWATWASKQAGSTIRQEDAGGLGKTGAKVADSITDALVPAAPIARRLFGGGSKGAAESTYDGVSKSIANGNRKVFEEIAPHFDRFTNTFKGDAGPNDRKWAEFSQGFKPDQQGLRDAFRNYYDARNTDTSTEAGKKAKAELMLMGNNRIGLHEQRRLQPEIEQGMPSGARTLITNTMMGLKLPSENLDLGGDLPNRYLDGKQFPDRLKTIDNPQLNGLLRGVDKTPNSTDGTGASDWTNIGDRMNFIVDLFRSRHDNASLYDPPFDRGQVQQMKAGQLPGGSL